MREIRKLAKASEVFGSLAKAKLKYWIALSGAHKSAHIDTIEFVKNDYRETLEAQKQIIEALLMELSISRSEETEEEENDETEIAETTKPEPANVRAALGGIFKNAQAKGR